MQKQETTNTGLKRGWQSSLALLFLIQILLLAPATAQAQKISIQALNEPLNETIYRLMDRYDLQISFNDRKLSRIEVSINGSFSNPDALMTELLSETGFTFEKQQGVYLILELPKKRYILSGVIRDINSQEVLPYAHLLVNGQGLTADMNGRFALEGSAEEFSLSLSYLGYYRVDTTLQSGMHTLVMQPAVQGLQEVIITGRKTSGYSMQAGDDPGKIRLNQKTARKLPGSGDNAVYNFLRLQPGILAAGESTNDLVIWGSYEGHSQIIFDGFTLYGLKNYNDNIGAVNPYMTSDITILKGGYGPHYGGRVGGIVQITGITGSREKPTINLNINNMTLNGMASVPVSKTSALTVAFRRTYYSLYDPESGALTVPSLGRNRDSITTDISVTPEYTFGDFNIKYSIDNDLLGALSLSGYSGKDRFGYDIIQQRKNVEIRQDALEQNGQLGGAIQWSRKWRDVLHTDLNVHHSSYSGIINNSQEVYRLVNNEELFQRLKTSDNRVTEWGMENQYRAVLGKINRHELAGGVSFKRYDIAMESFLDDSLTIQLTNRRFIVGGFITDRYHMGDLMEINAGFRLDVPEGMDRAFVQPRLSMKINSAPGMKTYLAWGVYNQFITRASILDDLGNYQYFWSLADGEEIPVLSAFHYVAGSSYEKGGVLFSAEFYHKAIDGLSRYYKLVREKQVDIYKGNSLTSGFDLLIKRKRPKMEGWLSYSYARSREYFAYFPDDLYRDAPQDQRHEVKASVLLNVNSFNFSTNVVYGSGLAASARKFLPYTERYPYKRVDVAAMYNFGTAQYQFEIGLSILNLLNYENIKFSNFVKLPAEQLNSISIHAEAVPFTPTLFLNLAF